MEEYYINTEAVMIKFYKQWRDHLSNNENNIKIHILGSSLMNHVQYLSAINAKEEEILSFFQNEYELLSRFDSRMVLYEGYSETVIRRVDMERRNGWK